MCIGPGITHDSTTAHANSLLALCTQYCVNYMSITALGGFTASQAPQFSGCDGFGTNIAGIAVDTFAALTVACLKQVQYSVRQLRQDLRSQRGVKSTDQCTLQQVPSGACSHITASQLPVAHTSAFGEYCVANLQAGTFAHVTATTTAGFSAGGCQGLNAAQLGETPSAAFAGWSEACTVLHATHQQVAALLCAG